MGKSKYIFVFLFLSFWIYYGYIQFKLYKINKKLKYYGIYNTGYVYDYIGNTYEGNGATIYYYFYYNNSKYFGEMQLAEKDFYVKDTITIIMLANNPKINSTAFNVYRYDKINRLKYINEFRKSKSK